MHIAYLTPEYPHERINGSGGMGTSIKNLVNAMVSSNVKVTVIVYGQREDARFEENGVCFYLMKQQNYPMGGFYYYRRHINLFVNDLIKKKKIDLIEAPDWTGITAFMKFQIPLVIRFHGSDTYFCHIEGRKQKWKNAFFERQGLKNAAGFIAPTHFAGAESARLFKIDERDVNIIPYGLVLADFYNPSPEKYQPYALLNVGTLIRKKGVFELVAIFNELVKIEPRATLTLVGADSPDVATGTTSTWALMQEQWSAEAKSKVEYKGKIPYHQVRQEILKAHVCVFPSLAETLGMVTIESMALQKAVVNTNLGWAQDIIEQGVDGFMLHPSDTGKYISTIKQLFDDAALVKQLGSRARQKVERKFDITKIAELNINFYQQLLDA